MAKDRSEEYLKEKLTNFIERVYKFCATYNVSATIMMASPGSNEIVYAGVGYTLKKNKKKEAFIQVPIYP